MKAAVWTKYGSPDGLELKEVNRPTPGPNDLLIRVIASTVTAGDCEVRAMRAPFWLKVPLRVYFGLLRPKPNTILGQEFAGVVQAMGSDVTRFQVGDAVLAAAGLRFGGYGEYALMSEKGVVARMPSGMRFAEAAALPTGGLEAQHFVRAAGIEPGEKVLIYGAGGGIGSFAVQFAKRAGATVTGVDRAEKHAMLRALGADHVIDYRREDFTRSRERYDVIYDVIGKAPLARSMRMLEENGRYITANPRLTRFLQSRLLRSRGNRQTIFRTAKQTSNDLAVLTTLLASGQIKTAIDSEYALEQIAEAHRRGESGEKLGHVIVHVGEEER